MDDGVGVIINGGVILVPSKPSGNEEVRMQGDAAMGAMCLSSFSMS